MGLTILPRGKERYPMAYYLKVVRADGTGPYRRWYRYDLPKNGKPGKWHSVRGHIRICSNGLHAAKPSGLGHWLGPFAWRTLLMGPERTAWSTKRIFLAETKGKTVNGSSKIASRHMRLVKELKIPRTVKKRLARAAKRAGHGARLTDYDTLEILVANGIRPTKVPNEPGYRKIVEKLRKRYGPELLHDVFGEN